MIHLPHPRCACAAIVATLTLASAVAIPTAAIAQPAQQFSSPAINELLTKLNPNQRATVETVLTRCSAPLAQFRDLVTAQNPNQKDIDAGSWVVQDVQRAEILAAWDGAATHITREIIDVGKSAIEEWASGRSNNSNSYPSTLAYGHFRVCLGEIYLARLGAPMPGGTPASTSAAPAAGNAVLPYPDSKLGAETQKALADILAPDARSGPSFYDQTDFTALAEGRPFNPASKKDQATANTNYTATKTRKLHNRLNDVTPCLAVDPTGVREEWGMEGRFRIRNTCSFPVEASWCANKTECDAGRGSLWKLPPKGTWPIFFADVANPTIGIGGCRTEEDRQPLPSDAAIAAAGGINTSHKQPIPSPGVSAMPNHRCD